MAEGIQQERGSTLPVVRTRRVELVDAHDRVRIVIGEIEDEGPYDLPVFGLRLLGPDGGSRAELAEDATGVRLTFVCSGNEILVLGAEDARTLVADDGEHPAYMPAGEHSEILSPGAFVTLRGTGGIGYRVKLALVLQGDRVTLRLVTADDAEALTALFVRPDVADWWPGDNVARLQALLGEDNDEGVGWVVDLDGRLIGFIQYFEEDDPNYRYASIDIVLHPDWTNRGLGTDAVRTLARHLFEQVGHHRITIDPAVVNVRAIASYRKVGFCDVGVMRRYELANDGTWRDALLMDLLADELA